MRRMILITGKKTKKKTTMAYRAKPTTGDARSWAQFIVILYRFPPSLHRIAAGAYKAKAIAADPRLANLPHAAGKYLARRMPLALGVPFHDHCRSIAPMATGEGPFVSAPIMPTCMHCEGDVMAYDADSLVELLRDARARQKQAAAIRPPYELIIPSSR